MIAMDELTHFSQYQFLYLIGRLRSEADMDSFMIASCNPDYQSWVFSWVKWYLDEEGYPDKEKCGTKRFFVIEEDEPKFGDDEKELADKYPHLCYIENPLTGETQYVRPLSFTFIAGTIFDNPALIEKNPKYLASLKSQSPVNRARLLDGNWLAREEGSNFFDRSWLKDTNQYPQGGRCCRAWDKASSEPSDKERHPDYTACSPRMYKCKDGYYWLVGDYVKTCIDKNETDEVYGRFRLRAGERDNLMVEQAKHDGEDCRILLPVDPGAHGKTEYEYSALKLIQEGFSVHPDPAPTNASKLKKAEPFFNACQNRLVYIVRNTFTEDTYNAIMKELESFDGTRSTRHKKDDWVDSIATAFNYMNKEKVYETPLLSSLNNPTMLKESGLDLDLRIPESLNTKY